MKLLRRSTRRRNPRAGAATPGPPANHTNPSSQPPPHDSQDAWPQKRLVAAARGQCSEAAVKVAAVVVVGALLLAAAAVISHHLLRPGPPPEDDAASALAEVVDRQPPPPEGADNSTAVRRPLPPASTTSQPQPSASMTSLPDLSSSQASDICGSLQELLPCGQRGNDTEISSEDCPRYYSPAEWGAKPPHKLVPMNQPIRYVVVSYTYTSRCQGLATCSPLLRSMQNYHLSRHYDDIAYNFLIADNGSVFEGRGWRRASSHLASRGNTALGVSYPGNYRNYGLTQLQISSTALLLEYGVRCGYLDHDYLLVAHNQTRLTDSPGKFIVQEISSWPHYSDIRLF